MTVLEMLSKVISPEELFGLVTFAEFVDIGQMFDSGFPIAGKVRELFTTIAAGIA